MHRSSHSIFQIIFDHIRNAQTQNQFLHIGIRHFFSYKSLQNPLKTNQNQLSYQLSHIHSSFMQFALT